MIKRTEQEREQRKHEHDVRRQPEESRVSERSVYEDFLARKWKGSPSPSPQAYARAIQLWRQLPGSITTAATDLGTLPELTAGDDSKEPSQQDDMTDQGNRS